MKKDESNWFKRAQLVDYDRKKNTRVTRKKLDNGNILKTVSIEEQHNPVVYSDDNPNLYFVTEIPYDVPSVVNNIITFIHSHISGSARICILSALPFKKKREEIRGSITKYYRDSSIDFRKYIPPYSKVIVEGRALYSFTKEKYIAVEDFYDIVFNEKTWVYDPFTKCTLFPVDAFYLWLEVVPDNLKQRTKKDNWNYFFAARQVKRASEFQVKRNRILVPTISVVENTHKFFEDHMNESVVAYDTETSSLDTFEAKIKCVTMAFNRNEAFYLKWEDIDTEELGNFLKDKFQVGTNLKYDILCLVNNGVKRECLHIDYDTWAAGHILNEDRSNSLKSHSWFYTSFGGYDVPLELYKEKYKIKNYMNIPHSKLFLYATYDALCSLITYEETNKQITWIDKNFPLQKYIEDIRLSEKTTEWSLRRYYEGVMLKSHNNFIDIELTGFTISLNRLRRSGKTVTKKLSKVKRKFFDYIEIPFDSIDIDSDSKLGRFFEERKFPIKERGKAGGALTKKSVLQEWAKSGYKEAEILLEYRSWKTLNDTFIGNEELKTGLWKYLKNIDEQKGTATLHSTFYPMLASTGRGRSSNPNMQNIPHHGSILKQYLVRSIFVTPSDEYLFGEEDGSGLQLRIEAALSQDEEMFKAFVNYGGEIHSMTGQSIYMPDVSIEEFIAKKEEEPYHTIRFLAKSANFSLIFNTTATEFARRSLMPQWTKEQCKEYVSRNQLDSKVDYLHNRAMESGSFDKDRNFCMYWSAAIDIKNKFFAQYEGVKEYIDRTIQFAKDNGYVRSPFGAIKRLPQLLSHGTEENQRDIKHLCNIAVNAGVQNYESVLMMMTINELSDFIKQNNLKSKIIGFVHDSILRYIFRSEKELLENKIREIFSRRLPEHNGIPMEIDFSTFDISDGDVWGIRRKDLDEWQEKAKKENKEE